MVAGRAHLLTPLSTLRHVRRTPALRSLRVPPPDAKAGVDSDSNVRDEASDGVPAWNEVLGHDSLVVPDVPEGAMCDDAQPQVPWRDQQAQNGEYREYREAPNLDPHPSTVFGQTPPRQINRWHQD